MAAFVEAIDQEADMIETDVRRTPDGTLVLHHDPLPEPAPDALCTLAELVAVAARRRVALDVELKEPGCESAVLAVLTPRPPGLVVTSFLPGVVATLAALEPDLTLGLLIDEGDTRGDPVARARGCGARLLAPHVSLYDQRLGGAARIDGLDVMVWTVNDAGRLRELVADPAVGAVITDDVPLARSVCGRA